MNAKQLLNLCCLKGAIAGHRDIAKCGYRAAYEALQKSTSTWQEGYFQGLMRLYKLEIRTYHSLWREITQIIKEAQNA